MDCESCKQHVIKSCIIGMVSGFKVSESDSDRYCGTVRDELLLHHKNTFVDSKCSSFNFKYCNIVNMLE